MRRGKDVLRVGGGRRFVASALGALLVGSFFETATGQAASARISVAITRFDHSGNDYTPNLNANGADSITFRDFWAFVWTHRRELVRYARWAS